MTRVKLQNRTKRIKLTGRFAFNVFIQLNGLLTVAKVTTIPMNCCTINTGS